MDTFSANSFKPARAATGLVDLSFVRRARVVSRRPFVPRRARGRPLLVARERSRSRGRSDPSTASTTPCRRRARAGARRERVADEEKFPHLKPPLRRPLTRPARASRIVEIATDRSIARPSRERSRRRRSRVFRAVFPPRANARRARHTHTHRLVAFAALKARTLPRTADCVMDAMVVRARE